MCFPLLITLDTLGICFASSGVLWALVGYFVARTASRGPVARQPMVVSAPPTSNMRDLEWWRLEGFEVVELYPAQSAEAVETTFEGEGPSWEEGDRPRPETRWAKVRHPGTGEVALVEVRVVGRPWK